MSNLLLIPLTAASILLTITPGLRSWWVLPEIEQARCRRTVEAQWEREVEPIRQAPFRAETRAELLAYYEAELVERLAQLCGVNDDDA